MSTCNYYLKVPQLFKFGVKHADKSKIKVAKFVRVHRSDWRGTSTDTVHLIR